MDRADGAARPRRAANFLAAVLALAAASGGIGSGEGLLPMAVAASEAAETREAPPAIARFTQFQVGTRNVKDILLDDGVAWIGTSGGLVRFDTGREQYRVFDTSSGLLANGIFAVGEIGGQIAVGTYGGGLSVLQPDEQWRTYNIPEGLADAFVYDFITLANGDVWIATWSGANRIRGGRMDDPSSWEMHTVESTGGGLPNDWVYGLHEGPDGTVWLATEGGLARYRDGQWDNWQHEDGLGAPYESLPAADRAADNDPAAYSRHHAQQKQDMGLADVAGPYNPNYVVALWVDRDGTVWAGTWGGGLARFRDGRWTNYTSRDGLPNNHVFALFRDRQQRLWIGTSAGLALWRGEGEFATYSSQDGLYADSVFSLAQAENGHFWVGGFGGVSWITDLH